MDVPFLTVVLTNTVARLMPTSLVNVILGSNGMDPLVKSKVRKCFCDYKIGFLSKLLVTIEITDSKPIANKFNDL